MQEVKLAMNLMVTFPSPFSHPSKVLRLLENMGLEQYTPTFKQEQINGDILSTCDDAILKDELSVTSRLHRMRLLRVIEGTYSVHEIMSGKDGYIFMASAGKQ